ncbi:MAG: ubiquinol-cytochrome c reductase iron-sulfur subunit [Pyrinomonadaceae bacterium]
MENRSELEFPPANSSSDIKRRSFFGLIIGLIYAGIAGFMGTILARYAVGPADSESAEPGWVDAGILEDLPDGKPVKHNIAVTQNAGWAEFYNQQSVWILKRSDTITVFSAVCPHLGCSVNTNTNANGFMCPCHNSAWSVDGERIAGPTLRGLDILEHKIENGQIKVKYLFFKQGIAGKELLS